MHAYRLDTGRIVLRESRNLDFEMRDDVALLRAEPVPDVSGESVAYVGGFWIYEESIRQCANDECAWRGPEGATVEASPRSKRTRCPECGSLTDPEPT